MKTLGYILLAALLLTGLFGFILIIGEPIEGTKWDSLLGIASIKLAGISCIAASVYGIKKLFN